MLTLGLFGELPSENVAWASAGGTAARQSPPASITGTIKCRIISLLTLIASRGNVQPHSLWTGPPESPRNEWWQTAYQRGGDGGIATRGILGVSRPSIAQPPGIGPRVLGRGGTPRPGL